MTGKFEPRKKDESSRHDIDVGDKYGGDKFKMLVSALIHCDSNITILSPTSSIGHPHKIINISYESKSHQNFLPSVFCSSVKMLGKKFLLRTIIASNEVYTLKTLYFSRSFHAFLQVTVMLVTTLCWWLNDGDRFKMLVTVTNIDVTLMLICWRQFVHQECWRTVFL